MEIDLGTGRTHQIRVHFSEHGFPLIGDPLYRTHWQPHKLDEEIRTQSKLLTRPLLHAWRLEFEHPCTAQTLRLEAPIPFDIAAFIAYLNIPN